MFVNTVWAGFLLLSVVAWLVKNCHARKLNIAKGWSWTAITLSWLSAPSQQEIKTKQSQDKQAFTKRRSSGPSDQLGQLKSLFHKLHHLERNPEVLAVARDTLLKFLSESLQVAATLEVNNILRIEKYDRVAVEGFVDSVNSYFCNVWNEYIARRQNGGAREMFANREECIKWLKEQAPVKLVDGAWLGHLNRFSTAHEYRSHSRSAWQVMSEELGDGCVAMNHAYLYQQLLKELDVELPAADAEDFIHVRHGLNDLGSWRSAVAQLLISLFPNDFLPEILGFNMNFELLTWDTLCATRELRELSIDDYYFVLHVSIDNAHSGHTAMATNIVVEYMDHTLRTKSQEEADIIWKRVQSGYVLSQCASKLPKVDRLAAGPLNTWNMFSEETARLFQAKSLVSRQLHCTSKARIGGRSLVEWMDPELMSKIEHARDFLEALSKSPAWIVPGDSNRSRLVHALSWGGRMFGAFSDTELSQLAAWIDHLVPANTAHQQKAYWQHTGRDVSTLPTLEYAHQDILSDYPVFDRSRDRTLQQWLSLHPGRTQPSGAVIIVSGKADLNKLLPIWFAQTALLEGTITVPIRTCNVGISALLRVVRAQRGFQNTGTPGSSCAGMDELRRVGQNNSLYDLGQVLMSTAGLAKCGDLKEIFALLPEDCSAAKSMLHMSMRPLQYEAALVGMSFAFTCLHQTLASAEHELFSATERKRLENIAEQEFQGLRVWMGQVDDPLLHKMWAQGFEAGKKEIEKCFVGA